MGALDNSDLHAILASLDLDGTAVTQDAGQGLSSQVDENPLVIPDELFDVLGEVVEVSCDTENLENAPIAEKILQKLETRGSAHEILMIACAVLGQDQLKTLPGKLRLLKTVTLSCSRSANAGRTSSAKRRSKMLMDCVWIFERCFTSPSLAPSEILAEGYSLLASSFDSYTQFQDMHELVGRLVCQTLGSCVGAAPSHGFFHSKGIQAAPKILERANVSTWRELVAIRDNQRRHNELIERRKARYAEFEVASGSDQEDEHILDKDLLVEWDESGLACLLLIISSSPAHEQVWFPSVLSLAEKIHLITPFAMHLLSIRSSQFAAERGVELASFAVRYGDRGALAEVAVETPQGNAMQNLSVGLANYASSHPVAERRYDAVKVLVRLFDLACGPISDPGMIQQDAGGVGLLKRVYQRCMFPQPRALVIDHLRRHVASSWNADINARVAEFTAKLLTGFAEDFGDVEAQGDEVISVLVLVRLLAARGCFANEDVLQAAGQSCENLLIDLQKMQQEMMSNFSSANASVEESIAQSLSESSDQTHSHDHSHTHSHSHGHGHGHGHEHGHGHSHGIAKRSNDNNVSSQVEPDLRSPSYEIRTPDAVDVSYRSDAPFHMPTRPPPNPGFQMMKFALLEDALLLAKASLQEQQQRHLQEYLARQQQNKQ